MDSPMRNSYDEFLYPSALYPQTHPDRLATLATLLGMSPAPVERCRVLELGCGDGSNLVAMAFGLPSSQFVGLDLAERPITKGQELIGSLALPNVALQQLDLLQAPANLGRFDYIIAHGLYSWVPSAVRDKLLALCGAHLAEQGVAYISYNAYPGNHLRDMARRMMHYHVAHFEGAEQQIRQGRALLKFLAEAKPEPDLYHRVVRQELERSLKYTDPGFFHDDLSATNQPVYFHEFIQHAAQHQLQYLAEADIADMQEEEFPEPVRAVLRELEGSDVIAREQYLDFLKGRAFRQTLLCLREVKLDRQLKPERTFQLQVASPSRPVTSGGQVSTSVMEDFGGAKGAIIATSRPTVKAALLRLGQAWPRSVPFAELLHARASFDPEAAPLSPAEEKEEALALGEFLLRAYAVNFLELQTLPSLFVTRVSERPAASLLARRQLESGSVVATLRHTALKIEDSLGQNLLRLLDGTRDRQELLRELKELVKSGAAVIRQDGQPVSDLEKAQEILERELEQSLDALARSALLVA